MKSLNRHRMLHKILSLMLVLMILVTLAPTVAYAEEAAPAEASVTADEEVTEENVAVQAATTTTVSDGNRNDYAGAWKESNYKPGTYTVTANIKMPGEYNPVLAGVDVYANNPNNPFGPTLDPDDPAENVASEAPTKPLEKNATLTVKEDGTLELNLPVKNPIFTTQKIGTSANLAYTATRLVKSYSYGSNSVDGRIYKLDATLGKTELNQGIATYTFKGSELYALPLGLTFKPTGDIALQMDVDLSGIPQQESQPAAGDEKPGAIKDEAPKAGTVTRTKQLDLCANKIEGSCETAAESIDKMATEGWRWERNANGSGGTLTLKNFYMKLDTLQYNGSGGAIFLNGDVKLVLEGTNVIETNSSWGSTFLGTHGSGDLNNLTVMETEAGGSLEMRLGDGVSFSSDDVVHPSGLAARNFTLQSGTMKMTHIDFGTAQNALNVQGGTLDVSLDSRYANEDAILCYGEVNLTGGKVTVNGGKTAIAQVNLDSDDSVHTIRVNGNASLNFSNVDYGLWGYHKISMDTTGSFVTTDIGRDAIYVYSSGRTEGCITIQNIGETNLTRNDITPNASSYLTIRRADYSELDAALNKVPEDLLDYTAASASEVSTAVSKAKTERNQNLSFLEQTDVNELTEEVNEAINGLQKAAERRGYPTLKTDLTDWIKYSMPKENAGDSGIYFSVYGKKDIDGNGVGIFSTNSGGFIDCSVSGMRVKAKELHLDNSTFDKQYALHFGQKNMFGMYGMWASRLGELNDISATAMIMEKKAESAGSAFYLVADYGDHVEKVRLESAIDKDGNARVMVNPDLLAGIENVYYSNNLLSGFNSAYDEDKTSVVPSAQPYIYVGEVKELQPVEKPTAAAGLVYSGEIQTGVADGEGYDIDKGNGTDAGEYTAVATLREGYIWSDGSSEPVTVSWTIAKADPEYKVPSGLNAVEGQTLADVVLPDGFSWKDDTQSVGEVGEHSFKVLYTPGDTKNYNSAEMDITLTVSARPAEELKPGTYRVTANLYLPGEKNTQLPGVTAYMTNPNNPAGDIPDNMPEGWKFEATAPTDPASDNATMVVKADGTRVVILDVVNPVFTLQSITSGSNVTVLATERDNKTYADQSGSNKRNGRITKLYVQLKEEADTYYFGDCVEFPTLLGENWNVPLEMGVDVKSAYRLSDSTEVKLPDGGNKEDQKEDQKKYEKPTIVSGKNSVWSYGSSEGLTFGISGNAGDLLRVSVDGKQLGSSYYSVNGSRVTLNASFLNTITMGRHTVTLEYQGGSVSADFSTKEGTKEIEVTKLKPGTYTVTANIWFEKADSGLPMNPHLTNSSFPPKDPVSNNATLKVDNDGRALVTVPIVIQSKVMTIQKITGLNIVNSTRDGNGNLTSITVDLGILEDFDSVITKICSVQLKMGDLAMSISGFSRDHTWRAHFQVNLSGVPTVKGTKTVGVGQNGELLGVRTGDQTPVKMLLFILLISAIAILTVTVKKRRYKR